MNIAVAQSGGPTAAINASLAGVIRESRRLNAGGKIYGAKNGIDGAINSRFCDLGELVPGERELSLLRGTPSTALGSCRIKLTPERFPAIFDNLHKRGIGAFFYIGGNDSMDTVAKLHDYAEKSGSPVRFVGIPKTIDNDLPETDHTPGFGSAAKYLAATVREIIADSNVYNLRSVTIIEVMGRDAGWLAASAVLLGQHAPQLIYLPEVPFDLERFFADIERAQTTHKAVVVVASEGLKTADGEYVAAENRSGKRDVFGHMYLSGLGKYLEYRVSERFGCKVRSVELNVCQRCAAHIASVTDLDESEGVAAAAVRAALNDAASGVMTTIRRTGDSPYAVEYALADVKQCANRVRQFPREWINAEGNGVLPVAREYFAPLIRGEAAVEYADGIPVHFLIDDSAFCL